MNRYALLALTSVVVLGMAASLAATTSPSSDSPLAGKIVLISQPRAIYGMHENVRFESVGQTDFIVVPIQATGETVTCDHWIPLKDVTLLRVFHSKADAKNYQDHR